MGCEVSNLVGIREQREKLLNEIDAVASKPRDAESVQRDVLARFNLLLMDGDEKLHGHASAYGRGADALPDSQLAVFLALIGRETLASLIKARMPPETADGITQQERAERISALNRQVADSERAEEIEIMRLEAAGHEVLRRGDADPALLLKLWDEI